MLIRITKAYLFINLTELHKTSLKEFFFSENPSMITKSQQLTLFSSGFSGFIWRIDIFSLFIPNVFRFMSISLYFKHPVYINLVDIWKYLAVESMPTDLSNILLNYKGNLPTEHPIVKALCFYILLLSNNFFNFSRTYSTYEPWFKYWCFKFISTFVSVTLSKLWLSVSISISDYMYLKPANW